jgi:hypothetical protein
LLLLGLDLIPVMHNRILDLLAITPFELNESRLFVNGLPFNLLIDGETISIFLNIGLTAHDRCILPIKFISMLGH